MTHEERNRAIIRMLRAQTEALLEAGPAACRAYLLGTGIYTKDGKLVPELDGSRSFDDQP